MPSINQVVDKATVNALAAFADTLEEVTGLPVFYHEPGLSFVATPRELITFGDRTCVGLFQINKRHDKAGWMLGRIKNSAGFDKYRDCVCTVTFEESTTSISIFDGGASWQNAAVEVGGTAESAKDIFEGES